MKKLLLHLHRGLEKCEMIILFSVPSVIKITEKKTTLGLN